MRAALDALILDAGHLGRHSVGAVLLAMMACDELWDEDARSELFGRLQPRLRHEGALVDLSITLSSGAAGLVREGRFAEATVLYAESQELSAAYGLRSEVPWILLYAWQGRDSPTRELAAIMRGQQSLAEPVAEGPTEQDVLRDGGVPVVACRIEGVHEVRAAVGRERGPDRAARVHDRRGELRRAGGVEGAREAARLDQRGKPRRADRLGEAGLDVGRIRIRTAVKEVLAQRARQKGRPAARKSDAPRAFGRPHGRDLDAPEGEPAARRIELPPDAESPCLKRISFGK